MRDSNPRMPGPEPGALPLGESPVQIEIISLGDGLVKSIDIKKLTKSTQNAII